MRTRANKVGFVIRGYEIFSSVKYIHTFLKAATPVAAKFDFAAPHTRIFVKLGEGAIGIRWILSIFIKIHCYLLGSIGSYWDSLLFIEIPTVRVGGLSAPPPPFD